MGQQINVVIIDEFDDLTQEASGKLDLDTGVIFNVVRNKNDHTKPWKTTDYAFTSGLIKLGTKELEFAINVDKNEQYHVVPNELVEIKQKLSNLSKTKRPRM
jgi:hypothetical protein